MPSTARGGREKLTALEGEIPRGREGTHTILSDSELEPVSTISAAEGRNPWRWRQKSRGVPADSEETRAHYTRGGGEKPTVLEGEKPREGARPRPAGREGTRTRSAAEGRSNSRWNGVQPDKR